MVLRIVIGERPTRLLVFQTQRYTSRRMLARMCQYMVVRMRVVIQGLEDSHSLVNPWPWGQGPDSTVRGLVYRNHIHIYYRKYVILHMQSNLYALQDMEIKMNCWHYNVR